MYAIRQHEFGGPEVLRFEEVPDPHPGEDQVRVRVESAGVHLIDAFTRHGQTRGARPLPALPMIPGREVAGVIDQVGPGVDERLVGQRIVVSLGDAGGGYAQLAVAPAASTHRVPDGLAFDDAVAMVGTGSTALAILEAAAPNASDTAIVTAAAGGLGTILLQALRNSGATVLGLAGSSEKLPLIRQLGADAAVNYAQPDWPDQVHAALDGKSATVAFDGVGGTIGRATLELLGPGGRLVMFGSAGGSLTPLSAEDLFGRGITALPAVGARLLHRPGDLHSLEIRALQASADGQFRPLIGQRYPLADTAAAHVAIESRVTTGKTIVVP